MLNKTIRFFLENKLVTFLVLIVFLGWGIVNSPFGWDMGFLPADPVPVDAIPDIGENQQIVYTEWPGHSPQDIEDQVSYPLTTSLLGIPGVKTIRSNSIFGLSSIYLIFEEDVEFYWSRTRILEKLNALPADLLPEGVSPVLGPDATALGQIYWYTLEGRDKEGNPAGGWDPHELRTIQDYYVRYSLTSAKGVAEVASIGGFVKEYQIDIDPNAMKGHGVNVAQIMAAVKNSNLDIGARTIEFNRAEYLVRALGYIKNLEDLERSVVAVNDNVPVRLKDVARVNFGPATRRGGLDKGGAEAVGGVVVARYGANPLEVIDNLKAKIAEITPGLPSKTLDDGIVSKVTVVPFYDRTGLIKETLGTLEQAITLELLISILVVIVLVFNLRASFLISSLLPIGVLITFIAMRRFGVDANIVALSGIAIAIGVMVDVGIVFTENIIRHVEKLENIGAKGKRLLNVVYDATTEVAGAVMTALATTIISFLPVFAMEAAEGKLFKPLAFTKTFTMLAALLIGLIIIPTLAHLVFSIRFDRNKLYRIWNIGFVAVGLIISFSTGYYIALAITAYGLNSILVVRWPELKKARLNIVMAIVVVVFFLTKAWMPLGAQNSLFVNFLFVIVIVAAVLGLLSLVVIFYPKILRWSLNNKWQFLSVPVFIVVFGITSWQGFDKLFGFMPDFIKKSGVYKGLHSALPGSGREFMPALDEGSFLLMPTTMPHSGIEENLEVIRILDKKVNAIPEVESVVGKWGRVNSALDPAPTSMYENVINYKSEYILNEDGHRMRFEVDRKGRFVLSYSLASDDFEEKGEGMEVEGSKVGINRNMIETDGNRVEINRDKVEIDGNIVETNRDTIEIGRNGVGINGDRGEINRNKVEIDGDKIEKNRNKVEIDGRKIEMEKGLRYDNKKKELLIFMDGSWKNAELSLTNSLIHSISTNIYEFLIEDRNGEYFRQWRDEIKSPDDIWDEIIEQATIPGLTSAPKLQPIQTRLVMLQTGMRAPMGIKVFGPDLASIEKVGFELEHHLKNVEGVQGMSVFADRVVGKPYLEMVIDRNAIARYGLSVKSLQSVIGSAIGGMKLTTTVEGRERFPVRLRYAREYRDNPEDMKKMLIPTPAGVQVPLGELVTINYTRGPQMIKSEDTFLVGYVIFDKKKGYAEVDVVEKAREYLSEKMEDGELVMPTGVSYVFTGNYENQIRATKRLMIVVPISLLIIFLILYFQFRSVTSTSLIFSGIIVAFSGGFIMLWLYGQPWFMDISLAGMSMRDLFQVHTMNLSVAVWVGFIALFGVATDDGVLISTYMKQLQDKHKPKTIEAVRALVLEAGSKRVRPAIMTTATTIIALLPVLTSTGKGSDIMVPMAIPLFGGMIIEVLTMFVVPVLYSMWWEGRVGE